MKRKREKILKSKIKLNKTQSMILTSRFRESSQEEAMRRRNLERVRLTSTGSKMIRIT